MKKLITVTVILVLAAVIACGGAYAQVPAEEGVIRLHIKAAGDSEADQSLKLKVRDEINALLQGRMTDVENMDEAYMRIDEAMPDIKAAAEAVLRKNGSADTVSVSLGKQELHTRVYGGTVYRAGEYEALIVRIGPGQGRNWWCVLFPSACYTTGGKNFSYGSRIVNFFKSIFRK